MSTSPARIELVLREDRIIETVATLRRRISDRFPDSGLAELCGQLHEVACQAAERSTAIGKPILWIRLVAYAVAAALVVFLVVAIYFAINQGGVPVKEGGDPISLFDWLQAVESGLNDLIFFAITIFFLISLENRIKRRRALAAIHELRAVAHIIDMHQLTKDPERFWRSGSESGDDTKNSPRRSMTPFLLHRYLDYCSEMLSLTGKIAALYVQHFDDAAAVAAVSEVEQLTTGLSRKIWQKIMILEQSRESLRRVDPQKKQADAPE